FFFFQAEDGIRDRNVTGVQTCALPISATHVSPAASAARTGSGVVEFGTRGHRKAKPIEAQSQCTSCRGRRGRNRRSSCGSAIRRTTTVGAPSTSVGE